MCNCYLILSSNCLKCRYFWYVDVETGETREGTPDNILLETVKQLNEAENQIKTLRQQMRDTNNGEHFSWIEHQMEQCIENELQCNICYELFIKVIYY